jgi:hypothetical protein
MGRKKKLKIKMVELFGLIKNFWYIRKKPKKIIMSKTYYSERDKCSIRQKLKYYQEKVDQWELLNSYGEMWDEDDIKQYNEWLETIEELKSRLN